MLRPHSSPRRVSCAVPPCCPCDALGAHLLHAQKAALQSSTVTACTDAREGSMLQEVSQQLTESQGQLKQEKKRVEALQRQLKKVQDEKAESTASSSAQDKIAEAQSARIRLLERAVEERVAFGEASESALIQAKHAAANKVCPSMYSPGAFGEASEAVLIQTKHSAVNKVCPSMYSPGH